MNNDGSVVAIMSMSLDGYIADSRDGVEDVFSWYFNSGNVEIATGGADAMTFKVSEPSANYIKKFTSRLGAVLAGRRTFNVAQGWGGNHAWGPAFVITHKVPDEWPKEGTNVHFVTDNIVSAVKAAKLAAKGKAVAVHGAAVIQQLLNMGLLDEIQVDIAAILLGSGVKLFDKLSGAPIELENPTVVQGNGVTHLSYKVIKK